MILHVDSNSFYASCEQLFRPDLDGKPIAVLSNNDGVTIALNQACKDLGFRRGDIYFKVKDLYKEKGVYVFSSNYTLYADISARLNLIYNQFCPNVELYSIDESFLLFPDWKNVDFVELGRQLKEDVWRETHMPVSVGGAPTKTLAKMCNKLAKRRGGVCIWDTLDKKAELEAYDVADIWGIGSSKAKTLYSMGIHNSYQLANFPLDKAKQALSITGFRTVQELNEVPALDVQKSSNRDNIGTSKSFSKGVKDLEQLETALCEYCQLAIERMHREHSVCRVIAVFIGTSYDFTKKHQEEQYFNYAAMVLNEPTGYLPIILDNAKVLLHKLYRPGFAYRKVQINLMALQNENDVQPELFENELSANQKKHQALMDSFTNINGKFGRGCLHLGTRNQTKKNGWLMNRDFLSPSYTTRLLETPEVF